MAMSVRRRRISRSVLLASAVVMLLLLLPGDVRPDRYYCCRRPRKNLRQSFPAWPSAVDAVEDAARSDQQQDHLYQQHVYGRMANVLLIAERRHGPPHPAAACHPRPARRRPRDSRSSDQSRVGRGGERRRRGGRPPSSQYWRYMPTYSPRTWLVADQYRQGRERDTRNGLARGSEIQLSDLTVGASRPLVGG